jgi:hypothetical protein
MFDHSNSHNRIRPDGLNVNKISKHFGGSQPKMRDTVITEDNLGPYNVSEYKLKVGDIQNCVFSSADGGPIHLSTEK